MPSNENIYKCDRCGGVFVSEWSEEEKLAEAKENFGDIPEEDRASVCDDCYNAFMGWLNAKTPEERSELEAQRQAEYNAK